MNQNHFTSFVSPSRAADAARLVLPQGFIEVLEAALAAGERAVLAEGEPGTGKTTLGRYLGYQAREAGGDFIFAQANAWASDESLIRGVNLEGFVERDASRLWTAGALLKAARAAEDRPGRPVVLLLDEWDKTRPVADGLLLAALEERVVVDAAGNLHGHLPPTVLVWVTSNATRELHPALVRRMLRVTFPVLERRQIVALLRQRAGAGRHLAAALASLAEDARAAGRPLALSELVRTARVAVRLTGVEACRYLAEGLLKGAAAEMRRDAGADIWAALCRDRRPGGER